MIEILSSVDSILGSIALITVTIKKKEKMEDDKKGKVKDSKEKNDEAQYSLARLLNPSFNHLLTSITIL